MVARLLARGFLLGQVSRQAFCSNVINVSFFQHSLSLSRHTGAWRRKREKRKKK